MFKILDCPPRERLRRAIILATVLGVIYVPGIVTFAMLIAVRRHCSRAPWFSFEPAQATEEPPDRERTRIDAQA